MARTNFERLRVYQLSQKLGDQIWHVVVGCNNFARDTVGKQVVRSADSIGANLSEGSGRGRYLDNQRSVRLARGSLNKPIITELGPSLNAYLKSIGTAPGRTQEIKNDPGRTNN